MTMLYTLPNPASQPVSTAADDSGSTPSHRAEYVKAPVANLKPDTPLPPAQSPPWPRTLTQSDRSFLGEYEYQRLLREGAYV